MSQVLPFVLVTLHITQQTVDYKAPYYNLEARQTHSQESNQLGHILYVHMYPIHWTCWNKSRKPERKSLSNSLWRFKK